jgi:hypothetical protein
MPRAHPRRTHRGRAHGPRTIAPRTPPGGHSARARARNRSLILRFWGSDFFDVFLRADGRRVRPSRR